MILESINQIKNSKNNLQLIRVYLFQKKHKNFKRLFLHKKPLKF